jgi:hypothetical protein
MAAYKMYSVVAKSFEGRIPLSHKFDLPGLSYDEVRQAVYNR